MDPNSVECVLRSALVEEIPGRDAQLERLRKQREELERMIGELEHKQEKAKLMLRVFDIYTGRETNYRLPR